MREIRVLCRSETVMDKYPEDLQVRYLKHTVYAMMISATLFINIKIRE